MLLDFPFTIRFGSADMLISTGGRTVDEVLNACVFGCLRQVFTLEYLSGWIM
jgi:hypothetical protein